MPVSLGLIKAHLNLLPEETGDDDLLAHHARVAETWISAYIGAPFDDQSALMVQAALLMVATMHQTREAITFSNQYMLPFGVHDLLSPLKERVVGYVPAEDAE